MGGDICHPHLALTPRFSNVPARAGVLLHLEGNSDNLEYSGSVELPLQFRAVQVGLTMLAQSFQDKKGERGKKNVSDFLL